MKKQFYSIWLIFLFSSLFAKNNQLPHADKAELMNSSQIPVAAILRTADSTLWSIFSSSYLGYSEFWLAYSKDNQKSWSKAFYTGVPVLPFKSYKIYQKGHEFYFSYSQGKIKLPYEPYLRASVDTAIVEYRLPLPTLYLDTDADGLTDLAEDKLWTDWENPDSDGDGKSDGFDQNPLAAPAKGLTLAESLHRYIINKELYYFWSNQLVIVEQFGRYMEYEREAGFILNLTSEECDTWVNEYGYGVPILTCNVSPIAENRFKVSFQFFFAPDDATGYEAEYTWDYLSNSWIERAVLQEWISEPEKN